MAAEDNRGDIHRWRLPGQPRPRRLGRDPAPGDNEKELWGGEPETTNNRMELTAAIRALEALKRPVAGMRPYRLAVCAEGHQRVDSRLEAQRLEDRRQEAGQECRPLAAPRRPGRQHQIEWIWVKGHAGHPENERADALANRGIDELEGTPA